MRDAGFEPACLPLRDQMSLVALSFTLFESGGFGRSPNLAMADTGFEPVQVLRQLGLSQFCLTTPAICQMSPRGFEPLASWYLLKLRALRLKATHSDTRLSYGLMHEYASGGSRLRLNTQRVLALGALPPVPPPDEKICPMRFERILSGLQPLVLPLHHGQKLIKIYHRLEIV